VCVCGQQATDSNFLRKNVVDVIYVYVLDLSIHYN